MYPAAAIFPSLARVFSTRVYSFASVFHVQSNNHYTGTYLRMQRVGFCNAGNHPHSLRLYFMAMDGD